MVGKLRKVFDVPFSGRLLGCGTMSEPTRPQFDALIAPSGTVHDEPSTENALTPLPSDAATDSVYLGSPSAEASDDPSPTICGSGMGRPVLWWRCCGREQPMSKRFWPILLRQCWNCRSDSQRR